MVDLKVTASVTSMLTLLIIFLPCERFHNYRRYIPLQCEGRECSDGLVRAKLTCLIFIFASGRIMKHSIKSIKSRLQIPSDAKQVHNYYYYPQKIIGAGNYSTVYEAVSLETGKRIAAKVINLKLYQEATMLELLEHQIQILLTLDHPNIIKCYDILKTSEECYCFTELCQGGSLAERIQEKGRLSEDQAWPFIRDIYQGLNYLNSKGIIHRDVKAANIFLKEGVPKIADFGFAVHSTVNFTDLNIGSPIYMAPEGYIRNTYGPKTEVWAFGITIYEMLHGTTPFTHILNPEVLLKALAVQIQIHDFRQDISRELKELIRSCLQIDEKRRISMAQIQFTQYMQRRQYNKYYVGSSYYYKPSEKDPKSKSNMHRYKSNVNIIKIPCQVQIKEGNNNENRYLQVPETDKSEGGKKTSKDRVIRLKSKMKIDNEPLSAVTKNPISLTQTIKSPIRVLEPYKFKIDTVRKPSEVSVKTRYYNTFYEPLSAQLK